jgi:hypothetical protein
MDDQGPRSPSRRDVLSASGQSVRNERRPTTWRCVHQVSAPSAVGAMNHPRDGHRGRDRDRRGADGPGGASQAVRKPPARVLAPAQQAGGEQRRDGMSHHHRPGDSLRGRGRSGQGQVKDHLSRRQHDEQRGETPAGTALRDRRQNRENRQHPDHRNRRRRPTLKCMSGGSQRGRAQPYHCATKPSTDPAVQRRDNASDTPHTRRRHHADRLARNQRTSVGSLASMARRLHGR